MAKCYFNDWILPALPKWDQDTYPYALIYQNKDSWGFYLMCLDTPFYVTTANGVQVIAFDAYAQVKAFEYWRSDPWEWKSTQYNTQPDSGAEAIYLNPDKAEYIWTNTDISDDYGTVVYPATDPVPIWEFNEKSFLIGYTLGIAGKPMPLTASQPGKEPVAYLYNGVRLPKLPEWDREMYPFAFILDQGNKYQLTIKDERSTYRRYGDYLYYTDPAIVIRYTLAKDGAATQWTYVSTVSEIGTYFGMSDLYEIIWSDFDIFHHGSTNVYLPASDPIPVYE